MVTLRRGVPEHIQRPCLCSPGQSPKPCGDTPWRPRPPLSRCPQYGGWLPRQSHSPSRNRALLERQPCLGIFWRYLWSHLLASSSVSAYWPPMLLVFLGLMRAQLTFVSLISDLQ